MTDASKVTRPSKATRAAERAEAEQAAGADRPPTDEEEAIAETGEPVDASVAAHYEDMAERGAQQKGEGRVP